MGQGYFMVCLMAHMPYMHIENDDGKMVETSRGSSISRSPTWVAWHLRRDSAWAIWRSLIFRDSQNAQASWSVYIYIYTQYGMCTTFAIRPIWQSLYSRMGISPDYGLIIPLSDWQGMVIVPCWLNTPRPNSWLGKSWWITTCLWLNLFMVI